MLSKFVLVAKSNQIATITLNRPEKHNAMHGPLVTSLLYALNQFAEDDSRVVIINGNGKSFCAGGDIAWMKKMIDESEDDNYEDAQLLADLLYRLYSFPKPTIVLAHGATMGGGLGLLAAADIAIAASDANFAFPEVKIGIAPSIVSPYVVAAIGPRAAHYYFLTGQRFAAQEAERIGLIHQITENEALMSVGVTLAQTLIQNSPSALKAAKKLIRRTASESISETLVQETAEHLAEIRITSEAQEGLHAFIEKRKAKWA